MDPMHLISMAKLSSPPIHLVVVVDVVVVVVIIVVVHP